MKSWLALLARHSVSEGGSYQTKPVEVLSKRFWIQFVLLAAIVTALGFYRVSDNKVQEQNVIVELQLRLTQSSVRSLQFISDSINYISLGIPAIVLATGLILKRKLLIRNALIVLLGIALGGLISATIKRTLKEPRPYEVDKRIAQLSVGGSNSFPSGHTVEATAAVFGFTVLLYRTPLAVVLSVAWALSVMFSRVVLGVHNFTDILGGIAIGCIGFIVIRRLFEFRPIRPS